MSPAIWPAGKMPKRQAGIWGIDLGQCALKAIRLEKGENGAPTATAFDYVEYPLILTQLGADPFQLIQDALQKLVSRHDMRHERVAISVPGQSGLSRFLRLPPVLAHKLPEVIEFEARLQIPFPMQEVVWDCQRLGGEATATAMARPASTMPPSVKSWRLDRETAEDGIARNIHIALFAFKKTAVNAYLDHLHAAGIEVDIVQMAPLALCNFLACDPVLSADKENPVDHDEGIVPCVALVDLGTENTNLVVSDGRHVFWHRVIPLGGSHFTRAIARNLKLTFARAEYAKRTLATAPNLRQILAAVKPVLNDFVAEVRRSLGFFTNLNRKAHVEYLMGVGNGFRFPGLAKYLEEELKLPVRRLEQLDSLRGGEITTSPTFVENLPSFAVAYGLALQGVQQTPITVNLLPPEIRFQQQVRGKKPTLALAAAMLLLALACLTWGRSAEYRAVTDPAVQRAIVSGENTLDRASRLVKEYSTLESEIAEIKQVTGRLSAGPDQADNWHLLCKYINDALPRPDGSGLALRTRDNNRPQDDYLTDQARHAFAMAKQAGSGEEQRPPLPAGTAGAERFARQHLIQINIESIDSLYGDDLPGTFFKKLAEASRDVPLPGLSYAERKRLSGASDKRELPQRAWVIEVRGWTYHQRGADFVAHTLVENLANPEAPGLGRTLSPAMKARVKERISFVCLYAASKESGSGLGSMLQRSSLRGLLAQRKVAVQKQGEIDISRWRPIGHLASAAFGQDEKTGIQQTAPVPGLSGAAGAPTASDRLPRTEFSILLIWQESLGSSEQAPVPTTPEDDEEP